MRILRGIGAVALLLVAGSAGTYVVRGGDTLGAIAARQHVSVRDLVAANHLSDPDRIRDGQRLVIPAAAAVGAASAAPPAAVVHVVARGETLSQIAARHHTTVAVLARLNGMANPNRLGAGTAVRLPGPAAVCPVQGPSRMVSGFGDPRGKGRRHEGVDLAAPSGTPVVANVAGVLERHPNPAGGLAYELHGDDGATYYGAHLDGYAAADGRVALGQLIGAVGNTGNARGGLPHLHFERWPGGGPAVDPLPALRVVCPSLS